MPEMPAVIIWNIVVTLIVAPLAFFVRGSLERVAKLEQALSDTREMIARDYATRADLHTDITRLHERFDRLEEKLDKMMALRSAGK